MLEVRIDPTAELWTSPGTYRAVTFYVSLKDNDTSATVPAKNVSIIDAPSDSGVSLLVSHYERFPRAPKRHAQFVKSLRPKSLDLRSNSEAEKITLTIFAPDYVDNGTQVIITLVLQVCKQLLVLKPNLNIFCVGKTLGDTSIKQGQCQG